MILTMRASSVFMWPGRAVYAASAGRADSRESFRFRRIAVKPCMTVSRLKGVMRDEQWATGIR